MANINFPSPATNGQIYTYGAATYVYDSSIPGWLAYPTLPGGVPAGTIAAWVTNTAPANWMICDGSAISRSTYASLFNVIGTTYGVGDGSTTFNLPNLKGRVPTGRDAAQTEFDTLGEVGGNKTLALYGTGTSTGYGLTYSASMNSADTGTASNLPPYQVVNYIIKTSMANTPGDSALATRVGALETFNTVAQPVSVGGTGASSLTSGGYLKGAGTSAITSQTGIPAGDITSGNLSLSVGGTGFTTGTGMTLVKSQDVGSGVSAVTVTGAFSSTFDNYRVVYTGGTGSTVLYLQMKLGSTATGYYAGLYGANYSDGTITLAANNNAGAWTFMGTAYNYWAHADVTLYLPYVAARTLFTANHVTTTAGRNYGGYLDTASSYTDFTFTCSTGTITGGTIYVYGLKK